VRRLTLFRRLPKLFGAPTPTVDEDFPLPTAEAVSFADDLAVLDEALIDHFTELDRTAQIEQNRHRRQQVLLILGGLLTTAFGATQVALPDQRWPGIVVAGVAAGTSAVASIGRQSGALDGYLRNRLKAERLRSLYFTYLAGPTGEEVADPAARRCALQDAVIDIRYSESGPTR
jgi:hypothetical protein